MALFGGGLAGLDLDALGRLVERQREADLGGGPAFHSNLVEVSPA